MITLRSIAGSRAARLLVTLVLLALVVTQIDWNELERALRGASWWWFGAAVATVVAGLGIGAARWHLLLDSLGVAVRPLETARAYGIGTFSNIFLPTSLGGDALRTWIVGHSRRQLAPVATSVVVDRLSALACFFVVAWAAVLASPGTVPGVLLVALAAVSAGALAVGALIVAGFRFRSAARRLLPMPVAARLLGPAGSAARAVVRRDVWLPLAATGIGYQLLIVLATWFVSKSLNLELAFSVVAVASLLVLLLTLVPISIGGFGLREGGFVVLLDPAGVSATDATLVSLLAVGAFALASLPGALFLLARRRDYSAPSSSDA